MAHISPVVSFRCDVTTIMFATYICVPELESAMIAALVLFTVALVIVGLLLYGTHNVSTKNNRN
jgi:hypothetical protein